MIMFVDEFITQLNASEHLECLKDLKMYRRVRLTLNPKRRIWPCKEGYF